jgi:tRNA-Thr(GGU) m(6)t(6)A37 methyltransferase TsaA
MIEERFTNFKIEEIGKIFTEFTEPKGIPIQPSNDKKHKGRIEIYPEFTKGLKDLDGFSHIIVLFYFHLSKSTKLEVIPFLDTVVRGVFATRAPVRPNHIGLSIVELLSQKDNILHIQGVDMVNGTPVLDIKPYVGGFDIPKSTSGEVRIGWLKEFVDESGRRRADNRFEK